MWQNLKQFFWKECMITEQWKRVILRNHTHQIVHSSAMYYQNLFIIHECSKKLLKMKNSQSLLKHKDSFGKSENLSKIFFAEILVFDHGYEGKLSSSNGLLWISYIFFEIIYLNYFSNCSEGLRTNLYTLSTILCKV